ncbi:MAG: hypothetical protein ABL953_12910 [Ilumatobacteraceae bacterium]
MSRITSFTTLYAGSDGVDCTGVHHGNGVIVWISTDGRTWARL